LRVVEIIIFYMESPRQRCLSCIFMNPAVVMFCHRNIQFDLSRRSWSLLNRFRTGHGRCLAKLQKWGLVTSNLFAVSLRSGTNHEPHCRLVSSDKAWRRPTWSSSAWRWQQRGLLAGEPDDYSIRKMKWNRNIEKFSLYYCCFRTVIGRRVVLFARAPSAADATSQQWYTHTLRPLPQRQLCLRVRRDCG